MSSFAAIVSEFHPIIVVIEEDYEILHLGASRKISALLPYDYHESTKHYPVIYLQDGQNLFNPHAPFGDWAIDKSMEKMASEGYKDFIVIAIDHGEKERIKEYLPYHHHKFGRGRGKHYIKFMKDKLIPYVNRKYRTLPGYEHTGIGGSSMGGLISLYAGITDPSVFGKMMIFSPSLWISRKIYQQAQEFEALPESKIYVYAGGKESQTHLSNVLELESLLKRRTHEASYFDLEVSVDHYGEHAEIYWGKEFPKAIKWLFFNKPK